ncbi:MAG: IS110 family transposase [Candidatus Marinimicrobia bacterium]|nr:IS110 family transposase [Candidatus Neomarinimicrobiota bacterium]
MDNQSILYCGIDVSKKKLDVYFKGKVKQYDNTIKGIGKIIIWTKQAHYIFESTGGYERLAAWYLMKAGLPVSIINPQRIRDYAKSLGQFAKTDTIDSKMIYQYAHHANPRESQLPTASYRRLCTLIDRRHQLIAMRISEQNRLDLIPDTCIKELIITMVDHLNTQINIIEHQLDNLVKQNDEIRAKIEKMTKICGISNITALAVLAHLPEIGKLNKKEVAALAGLAPYNRDSGGHRGKRYIYGGRAKVRTALYMPAVCAITHNQHLRSFYLRLVNINHCPTKVALTAVMRKMIIALNSSLKNTDFLLAS